MLKQLRIGIDARPALWARTGIGTMCFNFIKLIEKVDPQNEYYFYFDADPHLIQNELGLLNCRFARIVNKLIWANWFVPVQAEKDRIDIYISFLEKEIPFLTFKPKLITLICDLIPLKFGIHFRNAFHRYYYSSLIRLAGWKSNLILTISENSKKDLKELLGIDEAKVLTVRLGVDAIPSNQADSKRVLEKYRIPPNYILAIGSTEPRKNNATLITAFNQLAATYPELYLVITGRLWRDCAFDDVLINDRIIQTGYVTNDELPQLYARARAFVYPSLYEGFGLPILEAMVQGTPVITSNNSSLPEVAGSAALYVNPHDAADIFQKLVVILENEQLRTELIENGRQRAAMFKWELTCKDVVSAYGGL